MSAEFKLFDGKNLSSLFKDIYDNQQSKKKNISEMIESLRKLIKNVGEATVLAPIIRDSESLRKWISDNSEEMPEEFKKSAGLYSDLKDLGF